MANEVKECRSCGETVDVLYTAPGGALVCSACLGLFKLLNMYRARGVSNADMLATLEHVLREMEAEAED